MNITKINRIFLIAMVSFMACKSYNPNSNLEVYQYPPTNDSGEDPIAFINKSLEIMYPNIGKYMMENKIDEYEVNFTMGGSRFKVSFDQEGNWKKSEVDIRFSNMINENVKKAIRESEFKNLKIVKKELEQKPGSIQYDFSFQEGEIVHKVRYNEIGEVLKYEQKSIQFSK